MQVNYNEELKISLEEYDYELIDERDALIFAALGLHPAIQTARVAAQSVHDKDGEAYEEQSGNDPHRSKGNYDVYWRVT